MRTPVMRLQRLAGKNAPIVLLLCIAGVNAAPFDWNKAFNGVPVSGVMAYSGCAPASDANARKIAILKAEANMVKAKRNVSVSGEEHLVARNGAETYTMSVSETAAAVVRKVSIVKEDVTDAGKGPQLCVLVMENNGGGPQ